MSSSSEKRGSVLREMQMRSKLKATAAAASSSAASASTEVAIGGRAAAGRAWRRDQI